MKKVISRIFSLIMLIGLITALVYIYNKYYFNDFIKANENKGETSYYRDSSQKYNGQKSYCIENKDYNDALFFKEISVKKDTP